jgi:hypothetical protein
VLVTANGTQLIVEVRVTHACEEAKLAKLRNDGLSAVEIDLRRFRASADRAAVEDALLTSAPREWLSNAKQTKFNERLRDRLAAEAERKAKEAEERAKRIAATEAQRVRRAQEEEQRAANRLIRAVRTQKANLSEFPANVDKLLEEFDDVPWSQRQAIGFAVHPFVWQAELVASFLTYPNALDYQWSDHISTGLALRTISRHLIPAFRGRIAEPVRGKLRDEWPRHRVPNEAVEDFLDGLAGAGFLWPGRAGEYTVTEEYVDHLTQRERRRQEYTRRTEDLRRRIGMVIARLPAAERRSFDLDRWFVTRSEGQKDDPATLCQRGDEAYRDFERAVKQVELLSEGGPVTEELLGLPLAGEVARAQIRERDRLLRAASQRRSSLTQAARSELGEDAHAWLSGPSEDDDELTRIDQAGLDDLSYQRARSVLAVAAAAKQETVRARNEASSRQKELRQAAAKFFDQDHLDLFLRASDPRLGRSPLDHCIDHRTLQECLALLPRARRGKFR